MSGNVYAATLLFILIMANKAKHPNAESCISSSDYDRPDHSFLSDIDPDFNYLNNIKESITSNYYNETTFKNKYENSGKFSVMHLNIRSVVSHFTEFICYLDTLDFKFKAIGLSETALNDSSINYHSHNDTCETNIRDNRRGGGVSLYMSITHSNTNYAMTYNWGVLYIQFLLNY